MTCGWVEQDALLYRGVGNQQSGEQATVAASDVNDSTNAGQVKLPAR
jgi:hypothetical protein